MPDGPGGVKGGVYQSMAEGAGPESGAKNRLRQVAGVPIKVRMELEIELQRAIATHLDWKERLRLAVDSSRSTMSVETACRED